MHDGQELRSGIGVGKFACEIKKEHKEPSFYLCAQPYEYETLDLIRPIKRCFSRLYYKNLLRIILHLTCTFFIMLTRRNRDA